MNLSLIRSMTRSAVFELENGKCFRPEHPFAVALNGKTIYESCNTNVFSLFSLTPSTTYTVEVDTEGEHLKLDFTTEAESFFVDASRYGLVADGETDNTGRLQAALSTCPRGGTVYVPAGRYRTASLFTALRLPGRKKKQEKSRARQVRGKGPQACRVRGGYGKMQPRQARVAATGAPGAPFPPSGQAYRPGIQHINDRDHFPPQGAVMHPHRILSLLFLLLLSLALGACASHDARPAPEPGAPLPAVPLERGDRVFIKIENGKSMTEDLHSMLTAYLQSERGLNPASDVKEADLVILVEIRDVWATSDGSRVSAGRTLGNVGTGTMLGKMVFMVQR